MDNKTKLKKLMNERKLSACDVAEIIKTKTFRPCSERTVRAWLADKESPNSRTCHDWVIQLLEQ